MAASELGTTRAHFCRGVAAANGSTYLRAEGLRYRLEYLVALAALFGTGLRYELRQAA